MLLLYYDYQSLAVASIYSKIVVIICVKSLQDSNLIKEVISIDARLYECNILYKSGLV
jgi:hypothetical protein